MAVNMPSPPLEEVVHRSVAYALGQSQATQERPPAASLLLVLSENRKAAPQIKLDLRRTDLRWPKWCYLSLWS